ncbi:hypothetical protein N4R57_11665 [Rhodobacteraceae bacterium D3-12]|nr:hypothetical protein N4R57_11665 [Rhodobacteraceae bacterium D3-12]
MKASGGDELWTFARFNPGQDFGSVDIEMDAERQESWGRVFGSVSDRLPRGMLVTAMMEAYIEAIQPRPDGNVHASQELAFKGERVCWNDTVSIAVSCDDKAVKKGRFWVRFAVVARVGERVVMTGTIHSIWAA